MSPNSDWTLGYLSDNYTIMSSPHSKGRGGGLVLIYKSKLSSYVCVEKYCCDTILWLKDSLITSADVYLCFVYIPHENNICYDRYNIDVFDNLLMNVAKAWSL